MPDNGMRMRNTMNFGRTGTIAFVLLAVLIFCARVGAQENHKQTKLPHSLSMHLSALDDETFASLEVSIGEYLLEINESVCLAKFINLLGERGNTQHSLKVLREIHPRIESGKCESMRKHAVRKISERTKAGTASYPSRENVIALLRKQHSEIVAMREAVDDLELRSSLDQIAKELSERRTGMQTARSTPENETTRKTGVTGDRNER